MRMTSGDSRLPLSVGSEMAGAFRRDHRHLMEVVTVKDPSTSQTFRRGERARGGGEGGWERVVAVQVMTTAEASENRGDQAIEGSPLT